MEISENTPNLFLKGLTFNNLCSYHLMQKNYSEAHKYGEVALKALENLVPYHYLKFIKKIKVFGQINKVFDTKKLKSNLDFIKNLTLLLAGYMNFAKAVEFFKFNQDPSSFLINGLKLSRKYLGEDHSLTLKINKKLSNLANNNESDSRETKKAKYFSNFNLKSPTTSEDKWSG
jgi:hypothetical protein